MTSYLDSIKRKYRKETIERRRQELAYEKQLESEANTDLIFDKNIAMLVYLWTGKCKAGQHAALNKTPKGQNWSRILAEDSKDHMKEIAYRMTDSDLNTRLEDLRTIGNLASGYRDIIYAVRKARKRTELLGSV